MWAFLGVCLHLLLQPNAPVKCCGCAPSEPRHLLLEQTLSPAKQEQRRQSTLKVEPGPGGTDKSALHPVSNAHGRVHPAATLMDA